MTRLAYLPAFEDRNQMIEVLSRAPWLLTCSPMVERIFAFVAGPTLVDTEWQAPAAMDPVLARRLGTLRRLVEVVPVASTADMTDVMEEVSAILRWKEGAHPEWLPATIATRWQVGKTVFDVGEEGPKKWPMPNKRVARAVIREPGEPVERSGVGAWRSRQEALRFRVGEVRVQRAATNRALAQEIAKVKRADRADRATFESGFNELLSNQRSTKAAITAEIDRLNHKRDVEEVALV